MQCTAVYYESGSFFARKIKNKPLILGQNGRGSVETEVLSRPDSFSVFFFFFFFFTKYGVSKNAIDISLIFGSLALIFFKNVLLSDQSQSTIYLF